MPSPFDNPRLQPKDSHPRQNSLEVPSTRPTQANTFSLRDIIGNKTGKTSAFTSNLHMPFRESKHDDSKEDLHSQSETERCHPEMEVEGLLREDASKFQARVVHLNRLLENKNLNLTSKIKEFLGCYIPSVVMETDSEDALTILRTSGPIQFVQNFLEDAQKSYKQGSLSEEKISLLS